MVNMKWYVLFVLGGKEEVIKDKTNQFEQVEAFIPKKVKFYKNKGIVHKEISLLFPNYVFIQTALEHKEFMALVQTHLRVIEGFYKVLQHDKQGLEVILPSEKQFLQQFTNAQHVIEESIGFIENDKVIITQGPLKGHESMIVKIDRHKRIAFLDFTMFGLPKTISVGCDIIKKI